MDGHLAVDGTHAGDDILGGFDVLLDLHDVPHGVGIEGE